MYIKLTFIMGIFINFLIHIFLIYLRIICVEFIIFSRFVVFCLWPLCYFCVFWLIFYMFLVCFLIILTIIIYHQVLFLFFGVHSDIDKDGNCFQRNNNNSLYDLWLVLQPYVFFLKFCFNNRSNIKLRLNVIVIVSMLLFLQKHFKTPYHNEAIRSCSKHEVFTFDYIDACENIPSLGI